MMEIATMKGLLIRTPWIDYILDGKKTWEIRGRNTTIRGRIALIRSQSGLVVGEADLVDCIPLDLSEYANTSDKHMVPKTEIDCLPYPSTYAWVLTNSKRYPEPIEYKHPSGAVIWVNLDNCL